MQIQIFYIPVIDNSKEVEEMNKLLLGKKIIDIEKQFILDGKDSFYSFYIRFIENSKKESDKKSKVDYREVLSPEIFEVFSELRKYRKEIAENLKIPVYAIFNNEELSEISKLDKINLENIVEPNDL